MTDPKTLPMRPARVPASLLSWFEGKTADDIERIEVEGRVLHPTTLQLRTFKTNAIREVKGWLRAPRIAETSRASVDALREIGKLVEWTEALPMTIQQAVAYVGPVEYQNHVICAQVSLSLFEHDPPHARMFTPAVLMSALPTAAIAKLSDQLDNLVEREDPRLAEVDGETFLRLAQMVAEAGNLGPLADIAGPVRTSLLVGLARLYVSSEPIPLSPAQLETLTQAATAPRSSG